MIGIVNTGGGGTGAALTVTAPAGDTVTVSKDGKSKTKVADSAGVAVFKGLATGTWTVTITDGEQEAQKTVAVTADYSTEITYFSATIHVTYPAGSTCTATDGTTTLTAPDTSGTWECVVPNTGLWTVTVVDNGWTDDAEITETGQEVSVDVSKYWLYKDGKDWTNRTGGWADINTRSETCLYKESSYMQVTGYHNSTDGWVSTVNKIHIPDGVTKIGVEHINVSTDLIQIIYKKVKEPSNGNYIARANLTLDKSVHADYLSINDSYDDAYLIYRTGAGSDQIHKIWME